MAKSLISKLNITLLRKKYKKGIPFNHVVIDNFWSKKVAQKIEKEIKDFKFFGTKDISIYDSPLEKKITCNHYDKFPKNVYNAFSYLNSQEFVNFVSRITGIKKIITDIGLHGGGLHIHPSGGKLNVHKDYSIHPKLDKERRLNLIIYMTKKWKKEWGGSLELWSHDKKKNKPDKLVTKVSNKFNRAILFDTNQNSWHGLPNQIKLPFGVRRQSMAIYYLSEPRFKTDRRKRALFAPSKQQEGNKKVLNLIKKRANLKTSLQSYRNK